MHNLSATPIARLQDGSTVVDFTAQETDGDETRSEWPRATDVRPDNDTYQAVTDRPIPLVVLEPAER